jgi:hypothetical protein
MRICSQKRFDAAKRTGAEGTEVDEADNIIYEIIDRRAPLLVGITANDEGETSVRAAKTKALPRAPLPPPSRAPLPSPMKFAQAEAKYAPQSLAESVSAGQCIHCRTYRLSTKLRDH